ncbi:hypothetical protein AAFN85_00215 [Mucilaginibacter sp. CAU 1740]|uniref:hypothetical protein n=1 Tax=Mucilaginibacter sp. CAU 1740 TaxID=3140365 RepID=UPI00325AAA52
MEAKTPSMIYRIILISACLLAFGYEPIKEYWVKSCQDKKYGLSYNGKRKSLGIPAIPNHWHIKERNLDFIWWTGDENVIGHKRKSVVFSGCDIEAEYDVYTLPKQNGQGRWIEIEYNYPTKRRKDSVVYTYQIEHDAKQISRKMVDSILNADKINKDY